MLSRWGSWLLSLGLIIASVAAVMVAVELLLPDRYSRNEIYRIAKYKQRFGAKLDWIGREFRARSLDQEGLIRELHRCGPGDRRVVVLSDSFVYGKGQVINTTWDAQLASMVRYSQEGVCVLGVGRNGWTTADEMAFLKKHWPTLRPDYLLVGYVTNDADFGDLNKRHWFKHKPRLCDVVSRLKVVNFVIEKVCYILRRNHPDIGYSQWEARMHTPANLARYRTVLTELKRFMTDQGVPFHLVLTARGWEFGEAGYHERVGKMLDDLGIGYTDTLPLVKRYFSPFPETYRWAHPGDPHASALLNAVFAWQAYTHLCGVGILSDRCEDFGKNVL